MHPKVLLSIDGTPVSGTFWSRLVSVTVTDKEGTRSDTIDLVLNAGPPFIELPRKKALITCSMGYVETGVASMGAFTADEIELSCIPYSIKIQGKSADMRDTLKEHRERHWDDKTVKDVVSEIASEHGLSAQVSGSVGNLKYKWLAQEGESALHFLERLAGRTNALFAIKDGKLIFSEKGAGRTPGGGAVSTLVITPLMIQPNSCKVTFAERESHAKVRAGYHDLAQGARTYEEATADPEGQSVYTLRHQYAGKDEAQAAAGAKAKELQRSADRTSVTIEGNTGARGGAPMQYAGVHPEVDNMAWIIETATHTFSKSAGYTTGVDAKAKI